MKNDENKLEKVVSALQADESFLDCVLEMIDTVENEQEQLKTGDDAEEAVVSVIQKAGAMMLQKWASKESNRAKDLVLEDGEMRPHEKKIFVGTRPLDT